MTAPYRFAEHVDADAVSKALDASGVAVLEAFLDEELVVAARGEVERLIAADLTEGEKQQFDRAFIRSKKIRYLDWDQRPYPALERVVDHPFVQEVMSTHTYAETDYPTTVIAQVTRGEFAGETDIPPAYELHTDGIPAHRFMFYLSDVGTEDGPLTLVPGAYREYMQWREDQRKRGHRKGLKYLLLPELEKDAIPMTGPAGTLIIFYTDSPHRAGKVEPGHSRTVFRINAGTFALPPGARKR